MSNSTHSIQSNSPMISDTDAVKNIIDSVDGSEPITISLLTTGESLPDRLKTTIHTDTLTVDTIHSPSDLPDVLTVYLNELSVYLLDELEIPVDKELGNVTPEQTTITVQPNGQLAITNTPPKYITQ
jgi:hypothetical protein